MRRILVTGGSGVLGGYLVGHLTQQGKQPIVWSGTRAGGAGLCCVDLCDRDAVRAAFRAAAPDVVLHAAALARIDECYRDPTRASQINTAGTALLAELCAEGRARLVYVSTDLVFDGTNAPYRESDPPAPLSIYGRSKAEAERAVLAGEGNAVVARVSLLFGPSRRSRPSFFDEQVRALRAGKTIDLFADEWRTSLDLETAARALTELAFADATGIFHIGGPERLSRWEMGCELAKVLGVQVQQVRPSCRAAVPAAEPRPRDTSLESMRWRQEFAGVAWRSYREALRAMLGEVRGQSG
jgi:dTDP-4-dehydrorhamnose reductase